MESGFYLSTGAKVLGDIDLGNYTTIGANAVVNQSEGENVYWFESGQKQKRDEAPWMKDLYRERYEACEELRESCSKICEGKMFIFGLEC